MDYKALSLPVQKAELTDLVRSIEREFNAIEQVFFNQTMIRLDELHVEPKRPRTGMMVLADGTDWNPGSGAGCYMYYGAAWHKLG